MSQHNNWKEKESISLDNFVVLDLETTGIRYTEDKIIEIAAVKYSNFDEVAVYETLINPEIPIPKIITRITGITQEDVAEAPTFETIQDEFLKFIGDLPLVGHNIFDFDIHFIEYAMQKPVPNAILDTLHLARDVLPNLPNYRLSTLKDLLGIDVAQSHRALADVKTTFGLLECCLYVMEHSCLPKNINSGSYDTNHKQKKNHYSKFEKVNTKSIIPQCECSDQSNPLCGKSIVFTGTLSIPREEAMQLAVNAGAILKTSVSRKTNYLVVGQQDISVVGADGMSAKERTAHELNDIGKAKIHIINEKEFLSLIEKKGAEV